LGISVDLKAKRDQLLRNQPSPLLDGAGTSADAVTSASALPQPTSFEPEKAGTASIDGARFSGPSADGLDAFWSLVVRARVGRIMRERANLESRRLADQILSALEGGPLSRTAIGDRFFRYTNRNDIGEVLRTLEAAGFVVSEKIETDGRPVEMWRTNR
jgi:hypothetical protein